MMIDRKVNLDFKESGCFMKIENLVTEQQNPATMKIDQLKTKELLQLINQEDQKVAQAVATQLDIIAQAVDLISQRFKAGGTFNLLWGRNFRKVGSFGCS
jgi:hypothetical protein